MDVSLSFFKIPSIGFIRALKSGFNGISENPTPRFKNLLSYGNSAVCFLVVTNPVTLALNPDSMQAQPYEHTGDTDLDALLKGDAKAFERIVEQESPRLFRMIMRIVQDEDEARSVMQETYLQAYKRLDTFRRESKFSTWLYAIGLNLARAALRKMRRFDALDEEKIDRLQPSFSNGIIAESVETWNPQKMAERSERKALVHKAIDELPVDYRTVITLRDIEELSTTEVAQALDISEGAVRVRLHRARHALRKLLDQYFR